MHNQIVRSFLAVTILMAIVSMRVPGFGAWQAPQGGSLPMHGYQIQHVYPHDPRAFTQGLQYLAARGLPSGNPI